MTTTDVGAVEQQATARDRQRHPGAAFRALTLRLHFYAGIFVAPFILIAAVTGALYAISPTIESLVDRDLLHVESEGQPRPLSEQVRSAAAQRPDLALVAVVAAHTEGDTTRVLFDDPSLAESHRHAVFVDPATAQPVGQSVVYGSAGALPTRTWIDHLHRNLHLGEPGRLYAELAASWLWLVALAGLVLWVRRVRSRRTNRSLVWLALLPGRSRGRSRSVNWHAALGVWVLPVLLLLSVTGLTWSVMAGTNITAMRESLSWTNPAVETALPGTAAAESGAGNHDHHHGNHDNTGNATPLGPETAEPGDEAASAARITQLDGVVAAAKAAGVSQPAEITVPAADTAFTVQELRQSGVLTIDSVAIDGSSGTITDRVPYSDWPLMAKLANWGVQFHMGLMFGLLNQLLLLAAMIGLVVVIVRGYAMWWRRRPTRETGSFSVGRAPPRGALRGSGFRIAVPALAAAVAIGVAAPLFGSSLLVFLLVDALHGLWQRKRVPN